MNTRRLTALLATLLLLAATAPQTQAARAVDPSATTTSTPALNVPILPDLTQPHAANRVIVGYQPSLPISSRGTLRTLAGATRSELILGGSRPAEILTLPAGRSVAAAIKDLWGQPGVRYVEPDYHVEALTDPNDPLYSDSGLWGMRSPTSSTASAYGSKADLAWADGVIGSPDVYVGIIDEGVNVTHPDLAENIWTNPFDPVNGRDDDGNGYVDDIHGWDFFNDDNSVFDGGGGDQHGTHVAGTIGALGGNGIGVAGVNWDVTMISTKFLGPNGGSVSDAVDAVKYLTDLKVRHGINIVASNNSWGGRGFSQALQDAVNEGGNQDILFVAAAGNSKGLGTNNDFIPSYPGNTECTKYSRKISRDWDCVIAVAAIDSTGHLATFSMFGYKNVDLGAPGVNIRSTFPNSQYSSLSGTSMAAPHVTGAIALCASLGGLVNASSVRKALLDTTVATTALAGKTATGGRLDVQSLIEQCTPVAPYIVSSPIIVGTVTVGTKLSVDAGSILGKPIPNIEKRWYRCVEAALDTPSDVPTDCAYIGTNATYSVQKSDVGSALRVGTFASNRAGGTLRLSAAIEVPVAAPSPTSSATVSGSLITGATLTGGRGSWSGVVDRYDYQWYACTSSTRATTLPSNCALIAEATSDTLVITSAQLGKYIRLLVTATNTGGSTTSLSSATAVVTVPPVAPTVRSYPSISGSVRVGRALSGRAGSWNSVVDVTETYQWYRCSTSSGSALGLPPAGCSAISGATSLRYTVLSVDLNSYLRLLVTATNSGGSTSAVSATTSQVSR